jgi:hypothetical protein
MKLQVGNRVSGLVHGSERFFGVLTEIGIGGQTIGKPVEWANVADHDGYRFYSLPLSSLILCEDEFELERTEIAKFLTENGLGIIAQRVLNCEHKK